MGDQLLSNLPFFNFDVDAFLNLAGGDPFSAMFYLFVHGGWIIFIFVILWMVKWGWLEYHQNKFMHQQEFILLRVTVPKASEYNQQTPRAVENIMANLARIRPRHGRKNGSTARSKSRCRSRSPRSKAT